MAVKSKLLEKFPNWTMNKTKNWLADLPVHLYYSYIRLTQHRVRKDNELLWDPSTSDNLGKMQFS